MITNNDECVKKKSNKKYLQQQQKLWECFLLELYGKT